MSKDAYQYRDNKGGVYRRALKPSPPTRGNIFIGSRCDDISSLSDITLRCYDAKKIFFSLVFKSEKHINLDNELFQSITERYALFPSRLEDDTYKRLLKMQVVHQDFLLRQDLVIERPQIVIYSGNIDGYNNIETPTIENFIRALTSYYSISTIKLERTKIYDNP